ncbi:hypothetical protein B0H14DRAFT_3681620, partial [Mycena olivaceomarginata]
LTGRHIRAVVLQSRRRCTPSTFPYGRHHAPRAVTHFHGSPFAVSSSHDAATRPGRPPALYSRLRIPVLAYNSGVLDVALCGQNDVPQTAPSPSCRPLRSTSVPLSAFQRRRFPAQPYIRHRRPERYCDWFAHHHIPRSGSRRKNYARLRGGSSRRYNFYFAPLTAKVQGIRRAETGEASVLFDYLADSVDAFLTSHPPSSHGNRDPFAEPTSDVVHLGLTFSFPVEQTALDSGKILTWTKGFSAKHVIGNDVVKLLQDAFDRKHMHVKCVALVNDTVGALLSRAYTAGGCVLGAIFGTGANGASTSKIFVRKYFATNLRKLANNPAASRGGIMVVNTEWGAFN